MAWATLSIAAIALSLAATGLTTARLRRHWDLHVSSVRWLFVAFFAYFCAYCAARLAYLVYVRVTPEDARAAAAQDEALYDRYSTMGIYTVLNFRSTTDGYVTALLCLGDTLLFAVAVWMFPLAYELAHIASRSMDRGPEKERRQIRAYAAGVHALIAAYAVTEAALAAAHGGYTTATQRCLLAIYFLQFLSFLYMLWLIARLRLAGRKYENVRGQFVTSPIYQRLTRIMAVYALFSFQYQLVAVIVYSTPDSEHELLAFVSVSSILYSLSGFALAVTTMCSQVCVLQSCSWVLPDDIEAQMQTRLLQAGGDLATPRDTLAHELVEPPLVNPVFVFTDIESSSALWAVGDGLVMQRATELHDNILRSSLAKYRGYEITTAGDAFQLAFHTIREAVEYCLDVQLQLLVANWPKELHNMLPATKKHRSGHRLIFNGLRVRMGIHDAVESDGALVLDVHAVTGKMIYTGAAEVIANEVGDLGDGGQILITKRVAEWLQMYEDLVSIECNVARVGEYAIPQIKAKLEVYQLCPEVLSARKKTFSSTLRKRRSTAASFGTNSSFAGGNGSVGNGFSGGGGRERLNSVAFQRRLLQQQEYQQQRPLNRHASQASFFGPDLSTLYARSTSM